MVIRVSGSKMVTASTSQGTFVLKRGAIESVESRQPKACRILVSACVADSEAKGPELDINLNPMIRVIRGRVSRDSDRRVGDNSGPTEDRLEKDVTFHRPSLSWCFL
jgi:hypothetical protein